MLLVAGSREHSLQRGGGIRLPHRLPQPAEQLGHAGERLAHVRPEVTHPIGGARRFEQGLLPCRRRPPQDGQRRVTDTSPRCIDDAEKGFVIGRIRHQPQIRQQILHFPALVEADRPDQPVRDATEAQRFFQRARLGVGPVEDGHFVVGHVPLGDAASVLVRQPFSLVALIGG